MPETFKNINDEFCFSVKGVSNNYQSVTPAPYQIRGKLRRESSNVKNFWIPVSTGMTFLTVALFHSS
jgi:hypothetical protein